MSGGQPGRNGDPGAAERCGRNRGAGTRSPYAGGEGAANAPSDARKRSPKYHPSASGGAASSTAAEIMSSGGSPPRKKGLSPGKGAPPRPEDAGGLSDGDGATRRNDEPADGDAETVTAHGTATSNDGVMPVHQSLRQAGAVESIYDGDGRERAASGTRSGGREASRNGAACVTPPPQDF